DPAQSVAFSTRRAPHPADDQDANDGPADAAHASTQAGAANDNRSNRVEFVAKTCARLRRIEACRQSHAGYASKGPRRDIDPDRRSEEHTSELPSRVTLV